MDLKYAEDHAFHDGRGVGGSLAVSCALDIIQNHLMKSFFISGLMRQGDFPGKRLGVDSRDTVPTG